MPDAMPARLSPIWRWLFRVPVHLYRWRLGRLFGCRFLLLIHVGRRTRRRRETLLEVVEYRKEGPEAVVMCARGRNADWLRNIEAAPEIEVVIGGDRFAARHRILATEEAVSVIAGYERRNRPIAPILRRVLSRLAGWPYRGSPEERRRLVAQLPLIAFRLRS